VGVPFSLETISFIKQKLFNFMKSHLSMLSLSCCAAGVPLRKFLPIRTNSRVFPTLSCINFRVCYDLFYIPVLHCLSVCHCSVGLCLGILPINILYFNHSSPLYYSSLFFSPTQYCFTFFHVLHWILF
jgi:hypothetical protein